MHRSGIWPATAIEVEGGALRVGGVGHGQFASKLRNWAMSQALIPYGHIAPMEIGMAEANEATLYRMVLPEHTCPFGVRAKQSLEEAGFEVEDNILSSRDEVEAFKEEHGVDTTPQVFIDGERIGGSDDLERYLAQ
jgi:glutaredoxin